MNNKSTVYKLVNNFKAFLLPCGRHKRIVFLRKKLSGMVINWDIVINRDKLLKKFKKSKLYIHAVRFKLQNFIINKRDLLVNLKIYGKL